MADKKFTAKAGYQNLLDYDPNNGIVKFGDYEAFLDQLDVKPVKTIASFEDYQKQKTPFFGAAAASIMQTPAKLADLKKQFEEDVASGAFNGVSVARTGLGLLTNPEQPNMNYSRPDDDPRSLSNIINGPHGAAPFRKIEKLGDGSYEISSYDVPTGADFLNTIADRANGLKYSSNTDILKQNQQDAAGRRRGAASTVLAGGAASAINS